MEFFFRKTDIRFFLIYYKWTRNIYFLNKFGEKVSYTILNSILTQRNSNNANHILIKGVPKFRQDLNFMFDLWDKVLPTKKQKRHQRDSW